MSATLSLYIPLVFANMATEEIVKKVFEKENKHGKVSYVDFVLRKDGINYSAYVHFEEWAKDPVTSALIKYLEEGIATQILFDYNYKKMYWTCLKNTSVKSTSSPAVRIDVSGLKIQEGKSSRLELTKEEEEYYASFVEQLREDAYDFAFQNKILELKKEEEEISEYFESEPMDEDLFCDKEEENEAWDLMLDQFAKEDKERALMQADYVRSLEEEMSEMREVLRCHEEKAWHAQNAWNQERQYLHSVANHMHNENMRLCGHYNNINM
jgi:hypothetical protein